MGTFIDHEIVTSFAFLEMMSISESFKSMGVVVNRWVYQTPVQFAWMFDVERIATKALDGKFMTVHCGMRLECKRKKATKLKEYNEEHSRSKETTLKIQC